MPLVTLIIGFVGGFIVGLIVAAGSWRKALGTVGSYATHAANTPAAKPLEKAARSLPAAATASAASYPVLPPEYI
jgi:hypothetical protein